MYAALRIASHLDYRLVVHECCVVFSIRSVSSLIVCRRQKFLTKFLDDRNSVCIAVSGDLARRELNYLIRVYL